MHTNYLQSVSQPEELIKKFNLAKEYMTQEDRLEGLSLIKVLRATGCDVADVYEMQMLLSRYIGAINLKTATKLCKQELKKTLRSSRQVAATVGAWQDVLKQCITVT